MIIVNDAVTDRSEDFKGVINFKSQVRTQTLNNKRIFISVHNTDININHACVCTHALDV